MKKFMSNTTLAEILEFSEAEKVLAKHSLPCLTCPMAKFEIEKLTIGAVCAMYGLDADAILKELNDAYAAYQKKK